MLGQVADLIGSQPILSLFLAIGGGYAFVGVFVVAILGNAVEHATARHRGHDEPHGSRLVHCHWFERTRGTVRGACPGVAESGDRASAHGPRFPVRAGTDRPSVGADHRLARGRRTVRLAEGRTAPRRLCRAWAYVRLHAGGAGAVSSVKMEGEVSATAQSLCRACTAIGRWRRHNTEGARNERAKSDAGTACIQFERL